MRRRRPPPGRRARQACGHGTNRAEGRATRDSQDVGIGQGIAKQGLQRHARQGEQAPDPQCIQEPRQPKFEDHRAGERIAASRKRVQ